MLRFSLILCIQLLLAGCEEKVPEQEPPTPIDYVGELEIRRISLGENRIDTVELIIIGETYQLRHTTRSSRLCDSYGDIFSYQRGPQLNLSYDSYSGVNCDSLRPPEGLFSAMYRNDSMYLTRNADTATKDITYKFRLAKLPYINTPSLNAGK